VDYVVCDGPAASGLLRRLFGTHQAVGTLSNWWCTCRI